jgi:hypothetical protein
MKILFSALVGLSLVSPALALTIDTNLNTIKDSTNILNTDGGSLNVNTNVNGVTDSVKLSPGSLDIKTNTGGKQINTTVSSTGSGVIVNSANGKTTTTINILQDASGNTFNIDVTRGLSSQNIEVSSGAKQAVLNLDGNSVTLIKSDEDLNTYETLVVKERPAVKTVEFQNGGTVRVTYNQPAKLFGVFKSDLGATVTVDDNGKVSVKLPWYSFLFSKKNFKNIKNNIQTSLSKSDSNSEVSVTSNNGTETVRLQKGAKVINVVTGTINTEVSP